MVFQSNIIEGDFISNGLAYDLQLPIETVQTNSSSNIASTTSQPILVKFETWNEDLWATGSQNIYALWFKGMAAGHALISGNNATPAGVNSIETTNGFTLINNTPLFGVEIVSITKANPGVVTFRGPGFNPGQGISAFATGDQFKFSGITGSTGTDWAGLNGQTFTLTKISSFTFSFATDTSGFAGTYNASSGIAYRTLDVAGRPIPPLNVADVGIRLGTAVVGSNGNKMHFVATLSDDYRSLGQL